MATSARRRPYQRRRPRPLIIMVSVLFVLAVVTWSVVLVSALSRSTNAACPIPAAGPGGNVLPVGALDGVAPVPAGTVKVRVLNAGGQRGQANLVAAQLADLGFTQAAPPDNDPLFPRGGLSCHGQLRFGPPGAGAAATLALVLPCTELMRDGRGDATVDVAVGSAFADVNPGRAARDVLDQLANPVSVSGGAGGGPPPTPAVDPAVLANARDARC